MHPNPIFRSDETDDRNLALARRRGFGTLCVNGDEGPILAHVPYVISDDGRLLQAHLVRSNPIWRMLGQSEQSAVMAVNGPDAYISPDWYGVPDQVPTWNYVAVHLRGRLSALPHDKLKDILNAQLEEYEQRLAPKPVWRMDKMTDDAQGRMMRMIAPIALDITSVDGTWKLSQNKTPESRDGAEQGLAQSDIGSGISQLRQLMRAGP